MDNIYPTTTIFLPGGAPTIIPDETVNLPPEEQAEPQTVFWFDAVNGKDSNTGLTQETALRTVLGGYYAKHQDTGTSSEPLSVQEDWYIVNDLDQTDVLLLSGFQNTTGILLGLANGAELVVQHGIWSMYGMIWNNISYDTTDIEGTGPASTLEVHHRGYGLGIFNSINPIVLDEGSNLVLEAGLWGTNNTGTTVQLQRGARMFVDSISTIPWPVTPVGGHDLAIDGYQSLPAVDPTTFVPTAARALTFTNLAATVAGGGFGGFVFNPRFPSTGIAST